MLKISLAVVAAGCSGHLFEELCGNASVCVLFDYGQERTKTALLLTNSELSIK